MALLPSSIEGLMGLWEEQLLTPLSFKALELSNESPDCAGYPHISDPKSKSFSEPLNCPSSEGYKPEPMRRMISRLEGNHRPSWTCSKSETHISQFNIGGDRWRKNG